MLTVWYDSKRNLMALYGALINTEYQEWESRELSTEFKSGHILEYVWDILGLKKKKAWILIEKRMFSGTVINIKKIGLGEQTAGITK